MSIWINVGGDFLRDLVNDRLVLNGIRGGEDSWHGWLSTTSLKKTLVGDGYRKSRRLES